ncbi:ABC transporter permease [Saccharothrix syringae]|uniref:FtsX-like permease family protein n=1 Tax=Saccharothrix syringae TaxID=103733 RepID=A0A5Q0GYB1_SACSY|nr:FtsX-like permease family protein [Saccharothrix syringae]QFZ19046.1 FtsX-like permease family protein [Saccharothrix syringae]
MSAVWRVARAAVRRRLLQTVVIGVVVAISTGTIVLALGLLVSTSAPFDRVHGQRSGAHLVAAFDRGVVSDAQLTAAADRPEVEAVAGPFGQLTLSLPAGAAPLLGPAPTTVGRADPGGPVDRLTVWRGRWVAGPGEVVLNRPLGWAGPSALGERIEVGGGVGLTVVGYAHSVSASADAWVTPEQVAALGPTGTQVLYRFTRAATAAEVDAGRDAVTAGLPAGALLGAQSYLALKEQVSAEVAIYIPFLAFFGVLGLAVAVLIVANVVSGAVVAGFRHIGVLKAVGFTPNQVMAVYLVMVLAPAAVGCVLGTLLGNAAARPLLSEAFESFGATDVGIDAGVNAAALLGTPLVVALAALLSALRARRLPAAEAVSAGSAPRTGRALVVQRWLGGTRLPRPVSLGLGVPFARPARSALTLAAVVLGVTTVTLAIGVTLSVTGYGEAVRPERTDRVELVAGAGQRARPGDDARAELGDAEDEALLRSLPGAVRVVATTLQVVQVIGGRDDAGIVFLRGDTAEFAPRVTRGHWPEAPDQVAVPLRFLRERGVALGDVLTVELEGRRAQLRIVGVVLANRAGDVYANWDALDRLAPGTRATGYQVQLAPGTDPPAFLDAVRAGDPGLRAVPAGGGGSDQAAVILSTAAVLTLVLGAVAALGVFNTVVLNTRERRRDLGMLKSIGMTPGQVAVMMVTSMGALGVVGGLVGLPLGVLAHRLLVPAMVSAGGVDIVDVADLMLDVYRVPVLVLLPVAGVVIAVVGALLPARAAGRVPIAEVLRNE